MLLDAVARAYADAGVEVVRGLASAPEGEPESQPEPQVEPGAEPQPADG